MSKQEMQCLKNDEGENNYLVMTVIHTHRN